jgi:hypothetical protein
MTYFDLRRHTRSISTCSPEAQRWFDLRRYGLGATRAIPFVKAECPQRVDCVEKVRRRRSDERMIRDGARDGNEPMLDGSFRFEYC